MIVWRHRPVLFEGLRDLRDRRLLLADDDVDADDALALLVDDRVEGDGGLAGLAVADDQLALAAADRDHGVDRLQARLDGLLDALPVDHARRDALDRIGLGRLDRALVVDRAPEGVHDAADERRPDGHLDDALRAADLLALLDVLRLAQQHDADLVLLEVERQAEEVVAEVHELARHDLVEAVDARDAVAHRKHRADLGHVDRLLVAGELLLQDCRDLVRFDLHLRLPFFLSLAPGNAGSRPPRRRRTRSSPRARRIRRGSSESTATFRRTRPFSFVPRACSIAAFSASPIGAATVTRPSSTPRDASKALAQRPQDRAGGEDAPVLQKQLEKARAERVDAGARRELGDGLALGLFRNGGRGEEGAQRAIFFDRGGEASRGRQKRLDVVALGGRLEKGPGVRKREAHREAFIFSTLSVSSRCAVGVVDLAREDSLGRRRGQVGGRAAQLLARRCHAPLDLFLRLAADARDFLVRPARRARPARPALRRPPVCGSLRSRARASPCAPGCRRRADPRRRAASRPARRRSSISSWRLRKAALIGLATK